MAVCLIVDDSLVARLVARRAIERLDFEIREAADGYSALHACAAAMPDVIFVDWNMPGMNGIDFVKKLRAMAGGDAPAVIFCTTENDPRHLANAVDVGANSCVLKPLSGSGIEAAFNEAGLV